MNNEEEIAQLIVEHVKSRPNVMGATLGTYLSTAFPGLHLRASYGGLKQFVNRFCGGQVRATAKRGTDDVYQYFSTPHLPFPESGNPTNSSTPVGNDSAWKAFSSPGTEARLWVLISTGEMRVASTNEDLDMALWTEIQKITEDEHRLIAREFLVQIDEQDRSSFQSILLAPAYWHLWFEHVGKFGQGKYLKRWVAFRFDAICEMFVSRAKALNIAQSACNAMLDALKGSKLERSSIGSGVTPNNHIQKLPIPFTMHDRPSIRSVVQKAIDLMSEEELRSIWLPVGVVADGLRSQQS